MQRDMAMFSADAAFGWSCDLPAFQRIRVRYPGTALADPVVAAVAGLDAAGGENLFGAGQRVAVTVGSRGISGIPAIIAGLITRIRDYGGEPFLVPAMGSHGGATAEGQVSLLGRLGITEETTGARVVSSMDVVEVGRLADGMPVYVDRAAAAADAILVVNRVKPHPDFTSPWESGLAKMTAVGLGKQAGADALHRYGTLGLQRQMPEAARLIVRTAPVRLGLAILENAYHEPARIVAVPPDQIAGDLEAELLQEAYRLMPSLPFASIDVLIVDEMGKDVSGTGMDAKILGRIRVHGVSDPPQPDVRAIAVLGLTPASHGNAVGIGLADVTTRRVVDGVNFESMYLNALTAGLAGVQRAFVPVVAPDDRDAVLTALRVCGRPDPERAAILRIRNTLELEEMDASIGLLEGPGQLHPIEAIGRRFQLQFQGGRLLPGG
jgi:hypothetical protein